MSGWTIALIVVVAVVATVVLPHEVRLYRRSRQRRGGVLELDTPEARAAIADPDDWFDVADEVALIPETVFKATTELLEHRAGSSLRRCNPSRKTHYHGVGDRCQCGERPNVLPFAGGDAA